MIYCRAGFEASGRHMLIQASQIIIMNGPWPETCGHKCERDSSVNTCRAAATFLPQLLHDTTSVATAGMICPNTSSPPFCTAHTACTWLTLSSAKHIRPHKYEWIAPAWYRTHNCLVCRLHSFVLHVVNPIGITHHCIWQGKII